jgi:hypothetical protein
MQRRRRTGRPTATTPREPATEEPVLQHVDVDALEARQGLRPIYVMLGGTLLVAVAAVFAFPDHPTVDRFGANVATEAAAILVTLVFVHRFLQQQDRARRLRASIGALRRASRGLDRLTHAWTVLLRGTLPRPDADRPRSLSALFRPEITEGLAHADPARPYQEPGAVPATWLRWAASEFEAALAMLHEIVVAYGPSLDPSYVEAVDDLIDDPFLRTFAELAEAQPDTRAWRARMNAARAQREVHFARLVRLLDLHNDLARQAGRVRASSSAPRSGVLGLNLEPDADLRIVTRISQEAWDAGPRSGSLCA